MPGAPSDRPPSLRSFVFAHPPISPICRTPLFPISHLLFLFLAVGYTQQAQHGMRRWRLDAVWCRTACRRNGCRCTSCRHDSCRRDCRRRGGCRCIPWRPPAYRETDHGSLHQTSDGSLNETSDGSLNETSDGSLNQSWGRGWSEEEGRGYCRASCLPSGRQYFIRLRARER